MIRKLKAHIIFISETKIDFTYPDNQCNSPFLAILYTAMTGRKWRWHSGLCINATTMLKAKDQQDF